MFGCSDCRLNMISFIKRGDKMSNDIVSISEMYIPSAVIDIIIKSTKNYEGIKEGQILQEAIEKWQDYIIKWNNLTEKKEYDANLHAEIQIATTMVLESYNAMELMTEEDGSVKNHEVTFRGTLHVLNSKEYLGYKILFREPPELEVLHWYHNYLGPFVMNKERSSSKEIYESMKTFKVTERIRAGDYLNSQELDRRYKILHMAQSVTNSTLLEPGQMYILMNTYTLTQTFLHLYYESFNFYNRVYGHIIKQKISLKSKLLSKVGSLLSSEEKSPGLFSVSPMHRFKVSEPIRAFDYLWESGLLPSRYSVSHVTLDITPETVLIPGRPYMVSKCRW